jgi:hypothetical protein
MRTTLVSLLLAALLGAPNAAHADCFGGSILLSGGSPDLLNRCAVTGTPATALAAIAAPVIVAGAVYTIVDELQHRTTEIYDVPYTQPVGASAAQQQQPNLALMPTVGDRYREGPNGEKPRPQHLAAFRFNERATNVATAVAGAAVIGAIIATAVKH